LRCCIAVACVVKAIEMFVNYALEMSRFLAEPMEGIGLLAQEALCQFVFGLHAPWMQYHTDVAWWVDCCRQYVDESVVNDE